MEILLSYMQIRKIVEVGILVKLRVVTDFWSFLSEKFATLCNGWLGQQPLLVLKIDLSTNDTSQRCLKREIWKHPITWNTVRVTSHIMSCPFVSMSLGSFGQRLCVTLKLSYHSAMNTNVNMPWSNVLPYPRPKQFMDLAIMEKESPREERKSKYPPAITTWQLRKKKVRHEWIMDGLAANKISIWSRAIRLRTA